MEDLDRNNPELLKRITMNHAIFGGKPVILLRWLAAYSSCADMRLWTNGGMVNEWAS